MNAVRVNKVGGRYTANLGRIGLTRKWVCLDSEEEEEEANC